MKITFSMAMRVVGFVAITLVATILLVVAGLSDDGQDPRVGWFEVSQR